MIQTLAVAASAAALFTAGGYAIVRAERFARQIGAVLVPIALMLGLAVVAGTLAQVGGLGAPAPSSRAEARPPYGMDWGRPPARIPVN